MSSPQQPWSPGQPGPSGPSGPQPQPAPGYGPPPMNGAPRTNGAPQAYGAPQGYDTPPPYGAPPQPYGAPQPGQHPQPGPPQPYGGGPTGELVLTLRKPFGAMGMISPVVSIDGYPASASWGRNSFVVPAGVRQLDVAQTYLWTYGRASQPVTVEPGRSSEMFYAGPMATFGFGGALGSEPQKRPGTGLFIGLMVFVVVLLLLVFLAAVLGSS